MSWPESYAWPTSEQSDAAHKLGTEYALQERAAGRTEPRESPLSGEWADDPTPLQIAGNVQYFPTYSDGIAEDITELADAWERGYHDAWTHSIEQAAS